MLVTLLPIVMEVSPEQSINAPFPILVTLLGMVIEVSPDSSNAHSPIVITPSGMFMLVKLVHWVKADVPMLVTLLGIVTEASL